MRTLQYRLCDVFTDRPFAGNALAVFSDASGLDGSTLQQLARELNLSECAFVLPAESGAADARLRIFTPTMELPFAGHPTLGAAFVLTERSRAREIRLETARGVSTVRFTPADAGPAFAWMTQPVPVIRRYEQRADLLAALGVERSTLPVELYDNGPHYVLVGLDSPAELAALRPRMERLDALGSIAATVFAPVAVDSRGMRWKSRVFAPGEGIPEDPATGAAAGPLALHLCRHGQLTFGSELFIEQGAEVGRPSTLHARATGSAERVEAIEVGGRAVLIGRGEIDLP
jgi:trans-2,3-dihydro-3-hydroxyanthranilate isomerase